VDNRAGAAGNIGAEIGARAPADGYTVVQVSLTHAVNANLYRNLAYDLIRDFNPVIQLASSRVRSKGTFFITATLLVCDENRVPSV
ncbi:MAG: hypothetical protein EBT83_18405, partial [Betaproteobacteria bacterium]|nr:hypothetical protein [Betaproteobacteria bacterium]